MASLEFGTETQMVICGDPGSVLVGLTAAKATSAAREALRLGIGKEELLPGDEGSFRGTLTSAACGSGSPWGVQVTVVNPSTPPGSGLNTPSASDAAGAQVEAAKSESFLFSSAEVLREEGVVGADAETMDLTHLGYTVQWTGGLDAAAAAGGGRGGANNIVKIGAMEVYWPW